VNRKLLFIQRVQSQGLPETLNSFFIRSFKIHSHIHSFTHSKFIHTNVRVPE